MGAMVPSPRNPVKRRAPCNRPWSGPPRRIGRPPDPGGRYNASVSPAISPPPEIQEAIVAALRGGAPAGGETASVRTALSRYECAGYLHGRRRETGAPPYPEPWESACAGVHRRTVVETLAAVGQWREAAAVLMGAGVRSVLLKGMAYLADLYPEPGWRPLVDVDLLMRPEDLAPAVRRLEGLGYRVQPTPYDIEFQRLSMERPGSAGCALEIHWSLGAPHRPAVGAEALFAAARTVALDGIETLVLPPEEAVVYHAAHAADHYFGPSLKWALDLREMARRWTIDWDRVAALARRRRGLSALAFARAQQRRLFPAEAGRGGGAGPLPGRIPRSSLAEGPAEFLWDGNAPRRPWLLRWLLADGTGDVWRMAASAAARPLRRVAGRAAFRLDGAPRGASD